LEMINFAHIFHTFLHGLSSCSSLHAVLSLVLSRKYFYITQSFQHSVKFANFQTEFLAYFT
jgi:hypothetical protein